MSLSLKMLDTKPCPVYVKESAHDPYAIFYTALAWHDHHNVHNLNVPRSQWRAPTGFKIICSLFKFELFKKQ